MDHQLSMQEAGLLRKGPWLEEEDERLIAVVAVLGQRRWDALAKASGLRRSGKSCRLRWMNYLRPNLKHGHITAEEEQLVIQLHEQWGNRWSRIARRLPGRTDNEIKNYWRSHLRKKSLVLEQGYSGSTISSQQNSVIAIHETVSPCSSNGDCSSEKEDNLGNSAECPDARELSSLGLVCSPYETRLTDWMSNWSNDQKTEMEHNGESCNTGVCYDHPEWISGYSDTSIWDGSPPIWDMD